MLKCTHTHNNNNSKTHTYRKRSKFLLFYLENILPTIANESFFIYFIFGIPFVSGNSIFCPPSFKKMQKVRLMDSFDYVCSLTEIPRPSMSKMNSNKHADKWRNCCAENGDQTKSFQCGSQYLCACVCVCRQLFYSLCMLVICFEYTLYVFIYFREKRPTDHI